MKTTKSRVLNLMVTMFLSALIMSLESRMDHIGMANAQTIHYLSKTGSTLEFLVTMEESKFRPMLSNEENRVATIIQETQRVSVTIRFDHKLSNDEITELEAQGLIFSRVNEKVAYSGTIYGAEIPIRIIDTLKERKDVLRIESAWQPGEYNTLDISVPEINADLMWQLTDGGGDSITGEGVIVANFDTGIDVFHPDFWKADGGSFNWIDTNTDGTFTPGTDAVDLDRDTTPDADEILDFFDAEGPAGNNDGVFLANMDWLYNDANNNGLRDYGTAAGFTEADPTYGELIFIVDDINSNNALDVGESLIALGTSKVRRTLNTGGTDRVRGTDLISTDNDTNGHGTNVCGIINGGTIGTRRYVGVAPSAELLVADRINNNFATYITWARNNGANVMLYEFGGWTERFLDGSSNLEQAIDAEAAAGIVQVVAAGNLGGSNKHAQDDVASNGGSTNFTFNVPSTDNPGTPANEDITRVTITALWLTTGNDIAFTITTPTPSVANLPAAPGDTNWHNITTADGHTIWYRREDSVRGTAKYDIRIEMNTVVLGGWTLQATNNDANNDEHVDMYIRDNRTSWGGGAVWTALQSNENTVTRPATADSAITVQSYSTRGFGGAVIDGLSPFSPAGARIDGQPIIDIAAPGNFDIASAMSKDRDVDGIPGPDFPLGSYRFFGGTSAAAPHVAAATALLLQWDPTLNHGQIRTLIQQSARKDLFTENPNPTPNDEWGHGKLDVLAAVNEPPVCDVNGPYPAECGGATTTLSLDGTGSSDPNAGDILTYSWSTNCPGGSFDDPTNPTPMLSVDSSAGCPSCSVSLAVTDLAGTSDLCSAPVNIVDDQLPMLTCPPDETIECDESTAPSNTGTATATDNCDATPAITPSDVKIPGSCPAEMTIIRTWTATDNCENSSTCDQIIEVQDTTAPELVKVPLDVTVECDAVPEPANVTATDNCDPLPTITYSETRTDGDCPSNYTLTRTWTATDACGNSTSETQVITVQDTTPPDISCNSPVTITPPDAPISFIATAMDNCDESPSVVITAYDCYMYTKKGKRIDKTESCVVEMAGDQITILDSGGVDDHIAWTVEATDNCGNSSNEQCEVLVVNPAK